MRLKVHPGGRICDVVGGLGEGEQVRMTENLSCAVGQGGDELSGRKDSIAIGKQLSGGAWEDTAALCGSPCLPLPFLPKPLCDLSQTYRHLPPILCSRGGLKVGYTPGARR